MKKLLSTLIVAALLVVSVACVLAVSAEEDVVVYDYLAAVKEVDNDDATVVRKDNGAIEITLKRDVNADAPLFLVESYTDAKIDLAKQTYLAIDFTTTGENGADFRAHYTRTGNDASNPADNYFSGAKGNEANVIRSGDTYVVWDITAYTAAKRLEDGHEFLDLAVMSGASGDVITINTYALVSDKDAMVVGTPLVKPAAGTETSSEDNATSSEEPATSSEEPATSSEEPAASSEAPAASSEAPAASSTAPAASSTAPATGDTGIIVFAVLAVLAVAGSVAVVRARH